MAHKLNKDTVYRAAKSKDKDYTINDGGGLYLLIKANGSKLCNSFTPSKASVKSWH